MSLRWHFVLLSVLAVVLSGCSGVRLIIDAVPVSDDLTETTVLTDDGAPASQKVAMIDVSGLIVDADRSVLLGPPDNPVAAFHEALLRAERDSRVKAVLVRINSPGGTVTASDVMYRELIDFKQRTGMPVVVLMADVAASGAYYLACAGDELIAHPTTVTGSIGVIIQTINFSEGMRRIGIHAESITSGPNKAMGSPFEPMPDDHRRLLQELVDEFYENFRSVVVSSRPEIPAGDLEWITDGRVVTGRRAEALGVVDSTGDLRSAFEAAKRRAGVQRARLVKYHRPLEHVASPYSQVPATTQVNLLQVNLPEHPLLDRAGFYYLWDPSIP